MSKSRVKRRGDPGVKCADLVDGQMRKTMDDLEYLYAAATMPSHEYENIGKLVERIEEFSTKWPRRPRKGSKLRKERDAEESSIVDAKDALSDDGLLVFRHYDEISGRGDPPEAFINYGLCFGYVEYDDKNSYGDFFRWQLSWGGPSDELQFYVNTRLQIIKTMYRYMDWFDGAGVRLCGKDHRLAANIWEYFIDRCMVSECIEKYNRDNDKPLLYTPR